jgi:Uma2 family endonuclease
MSSAQTIPEPQHKFTVDEHLALERVADKRHEYFDGEIIAMAGESLNHGILSANIVASLVGQLKGTPCFALTKDTKVLSELGVVSARHSKGMFSYPDILVACGEPEFFDEHRDIILNPSTIVKIFSQSRDRPTWPWRWSAPVRRARIANCCGICTARQASRSTG